MANDDKFVTDEQLAIMELRIENNLLRRQIAALEGINKNYQQEIIHLKSKLYSIHLLSEVKENEMGQFHAGKD